MTPAGVRSRSPLDAAGQTARRAGVLLAAEPRSIGRVRGEVVFLVAVAVLQWLFLGGLIGSVTHNGWVFHQGGDQTYFWTIAWLFGGGDLAEARIGYAWSLVETPFAWLAGPSWVDGLPWIMLLQTAVLLPLGLAAVYGIVKRLAGAPVARLAAIAWVAVPYAVIPLWVDRYHERYVDQFLPQALGLTGMGDYPSMVIVLCAAYLVVRHMDEGELETALLAGLLVGFAVGVKPSNALFLVAPYLAFLLARRWRGAVAFSGALVPALVTLAVWKQRGLGELPLFTLAREHAAAGLDAPAPPLGLSLERYVDLDWGHLRDNMVLFREYFWSRRVVEFLPFAGFLGAWRCSFPKAAFLVAWLAPFAVVKGSSSLASMDSGSFLRLLMPAWPAYFLLAVCVLALIPVLGGRLRGTSLVRPNASRRVRRGTMLAALFLAGVPLVVVASLPPLQRPVAVHDPAANLYVPSDRFQVTARAADGTVNLSWSPQRTGAAGVFYRVYRSPAEAGDGVECLSRSGAASQCLFRMDAIGSTRMGAFTDRPGPGGWSYRVAVDANYQDNPESGDMIVLSRPVTVAVPG